MESKLLEKMHAHKGVCTECGGIVKMSRNQETLELEPQHCTCLFCGQLHHMEIENIDHWEQEQWLQKMRNA